MAIHSFKKIISSENLTMQLSATQYDYILWCQMLPCHQSLPQMATLHLSATQLLYEYPFLTMASEAFTDISS